ncbi:sialate O-acetylesterase [Butyrivibrio sp. NC3005]|uniref:sialate O-acetylesterase n=1 Tax=Butyrivibrio sp. NC3005 TaxID=1280685 RepID=UPI000412E9F1|nr:sialate O-acetylesterase [Butyrivibrio sp. NC3005]
MRTINMPRLFSDGMVFQQKKTIHIWGVTEKFSEISATLSGNDDKETQTVKSDGDGFFHFYFVPLLAGKGYELTLEASDNENTTVREIKDICVGDVFFCSGQSNMDLMIERVKDNYKEVPETCDCDDIRYFKIAEYTNFAKEEFDTQTGEWVKPSKDTIMNFSASAYFMARALYKETNVPIGLIHSSLGGSKITSWMSRDMLSGYDKLLELADMYADKSFVEKQVSKNLSNSAKWHEDLDSRDEILTKVLAGENVEGYFSQNSKKLVVPGYFRDSELKNFCGSVWLYHEFNMDDKLSSDDYHLWLGTITDSDTVWVNGHKVGETFYQYPPRKYEVNHEYLCEGKNSILIRVVVENGDGRITPGKKIYLWNDEYEMDLRGLWSYEIGAKTTRILPTDFINWKPTGLYNGMTAPVTPYSIGAIVWYQGESNADEADEYFELSRRQIEGYRKAWGDESLPYLFVQLPNFVADLKPEDTWTDIREQQRQILEKIPNTAMVCAIDLGEDNDLHPMNKQPVGERLSRLALHFLYPEKNIEYSGPVVSKAFVVFRDNKGKVTDVDDVFTKYDSRYLIKLELDHCDGKIIADGEVNDFDVIDKSGHKFVARCIIKGNTIILCPIECVERPGKILYVNHATNTGALIYNEEGLPMAPFRMEL